MPSTPRPQMWLDSTLPKTHEEPIDPATGETDEALFSKLLDLRACYQFSDPDDDEGRERMKEEYLALRQGVQFAQKPHFVQYTIMLGAAASKRCYGDEFAEVQVSAAPPVIHGCHPETWEAMSEEARARYDVKTEADRQVSF